MKQTQTWYFFLTTFGTPENPSNKILVAEQKCKYPERTKHYKDLQRLFDEGKIDGFGCGNTFEKI